MKKRVKVYHYMCLENDRLEPYSGYFNTQEEARNWYETQGVKLEKQFNRVLVYSETMLYRIVDSNLI